MEKMMIMVVDGCAPEYLTRETAPGLYALAGKLGFMKTVKSAIPSVTNVNHACILSGRFPKDTGVVGNYYYKPETGEEGFIEERGFMQAETILQAYKKAGKNNSSPYRKRKGFRRVWRRSGYRNQCADAGSGGT